MDGVAKTAYYCCGVRAADAAAARPICNDGFAQRFMGAEGRAVYERFAGLSGPNATNLARCRIIDDWLREALAANPRQRVVLLGAGFDTRAFRLTGGDWLELDQPPLIAVKEAALASAEAPNPLRRVAIDFATEALADKLAPWAGTEGAIVVMEGVSMYLPQAALRETLATLRGLLPRHTLICDLMSARFARRFGGPIRCRIGELGGSFAPLAEDPAAVVAACGYREIARVSMAARARELGALRIPAFVLNTLLRPLRDGYCAYRFAAIP